MSDEEYEKAKKPILEQFRKMSKDKGLDIWKKNLKNYGISIEKAKKGFYLQNAGFVHLYFDLEKDEWLIKTVNPNLQ